MLAEAGGGVRVNIDKARSDDQAFGIDDHLAPDSVIRNQSNLTFANAHVRHPVSESLGIHDPTA